MEMYERVPLDSLFPELRRSNEIDYCLEEKLGKYEDFLALDFPVGITYPAIQRSTENGKFLRPTIPKPTKNPQLTLHPTQNVQEILNIINTEFQMPARPISPIRSTPPRISNLLDDSAPTSPIAPLTSPPQVALAIEPQQKEPLAPTPMENMKKNISNITQQITVAESTVRPLANMIVPSFQSSILEDDLELSESDDGAVPKPVANELTLEKKIKQSNDTAKNENDSSSQYPLQTVHIDKIQPYQKEQQLHEESQVQKQIGVPTCQLLYRSTLNSAGSSCSDSSSKSSSKTSTPSPTQNNSIWPNNSNFERSSSFSKSTKPTKLNKSMPLIAVESSCHTKATDMFATALLKAAKRDLPPQSQVRNKNPRKKQKHSSSTCVKSSDYEEDENEPPQHNRKSNDKAVELNKNGTKRVRVPKNRKTSKQRENMSLESATAKGPIIPTSVKTKTTQKTDLAKKKPAQSFPSYKTTKKTLADSKVSEIVLKDDSKLKKSEKPPRALSLPDLSNKEPLVSTVSGFNMDAKKDKNSISNKPSTKLSLTNSFRSIQKSSSTVSSSANGKGPQLSQAKLATLVSLPVTPNQMPRVSKIPVNKIDAKVNENANSEKSLTKSTSSGSSTSSFGLGHDDISAALSSENVCKPKTGAGVLNSSLTNGSLLQTTSTTPLPVASNYGPLIVYRSYFELKDKTLNDNLSKSDELLEVAKSRRHEGDNEKNEFLKVTLYLESVTYYLHHAAIMEKTSEDKAWRMYMFAYRLVKFSLSIFPHLKASKEGVQRETYDKVAFLSLRCQSLISLKLYKIKRIHCRDINAKCATFFESVRDDIVKEQTSSTPSPSNSVGSRGSGSHTPTGRIAPQEAHSALQKQNEYFNYLTICHELWEAADCLVRQGNLIDFFIALDRQNGPLTLHSSMYEVFGYIQSGLKNLREEMPMQQY